MSSGCVLGSSNASKVPETELNPILLELAEVLAEAVLDELDEEQNENLRGEEDGA